MNTIKVTKHLYIDTHEQLRQFYETNKNVSWMGFDTEFVGEKSFVPVLCLIQVTTQNGNYLIDPIKIKSLDWFFKLITDKRILKITHAGENDYRILFKQYGVLPRNVFDTQIAAGFLGYNYPISFAALLQGELKVMLDKGHSVSDWESRPISKKQLQYALNDVIYLHHLWKQITDKLKQCDRQTWVHEEFEKMESAQTYELNVNKEFLANHMLNKLKLSDKLFLLRLYRWRIEMAEKKNQPKERILQKKYIPHIVKTISGGKREMLANRLIPEHIVLKNVKKFERLYQEPITPSEQQVLNSISRTVPVKPRIDAVMDILYLGIKIICSEQKIAPEMVINRANFKRMKWDLNYFDESLDSSWRKELLGRNVINSIRNRAKLEVDTKSEFFGLKCNPQSISKL